MGALQWCPAVQADKKQYGLGVGGGEYVEIKAHVLYLSRVLYI